MLQNCYVVKKLHQFIDNQREASDKECPRCHKKGLLADDKHYRCIRCDAKLLIKPKFK